VRYTVTYWVYFNHIGAAVVVIIVIASAYIAFYAVVVSMHFVVFQVIAAYIVIHKYTSENNLSFHNLFFAV